MNNAVRAALAELGTEVRQLRAVSYAKRYSIPLHLRSSFHDEPGTRVTARGGKPGVACLSIKREGGLALVSAVGREIGRPHALKALAAAAAAGIRPGTKTLFSKNSFSLRVPARDGEKLLRALHAEFFG